MEDTDIMLIRHTSWQKYHTNKAISIRAFFPSQSHMEEKVS